jgi:hypothetical protein
MQVRGKILSTSAMALHLRPQISLYKNMILNRNTARHARRAVLTKVETLISIAHANARQWMWPTDWNQPDFVLQSGSGR